MTLQDPVRRHYSDYYFLGDNKKVLRSNDKHSKSAQQFHDRAVEQVNAFKQCVKAYQHQLRGDLDKDSEHSSRRSNREKMAWYMNEAHKQASNVTEAELLMNRAVWFRASQM